MSTELLKKVAKIAHTNPETRAQLVPLLRKHGCGCGGGPMAGGDEEMAGRTWGNPDPRARPDDAVPYNKHPDSPPAGADGSAQRKKYNDWFRKNVCPGHATTCGDPSLAR